MPTNKHNLLLNRTFQYLGIILIMAAMGGGYWYWKNAQAGLNINTSQEGTLGNGLVGYWPFDGNDISGTTAYDRSTGGNNGALTNGPTITPGRSGQALSFDGSDDRVSIPHSANYVFGSGSFAFGFWVKTSGYVNRGSGLNAMIARGNWNADYAIAIDSANKPVFNRGGTSITGTKTLNDNQWHYLVGCKNGTTLELYIDGIKDPATATDVGSSSGTANLNLATDGLSSRLFSGSIDEPRIYNRALSASEIWSLYQSGKPDEVNTGTSQIDPLEKGMVGYWKLDDASGTSAVDSSGNANTGTLTNGPTWTTGQIGGATTFDGTDDYIDTNQSTQYNFSNTTFTAVGWFKTTQSTSGMILAKHTIGGAGGWFIDVNNQTANKLDVVIKGTGGGNAATLSTSSNVNDGAWHHFVVIMTTDTATSTNNNIVMYLDGVINSGSIGRNGELYGANANTLKFGRRETQNYFNGSIDEVRIYNRALSAEEVAKLYKTTVPDNPDTGLVGYWPFDGKDISGTTAYDRSGKGNNGTLTNGPSVTPGRSGQALNFDGADDYVTVPDSDPLDFTSDATISVWAKADNWTGEGALAISTLVKKDTNYILRKDAHSSYGGSGLKLWWWDGTNILVHKIATLPTTGEWHHIVGVIENNSTRKIYVDGTLQSGTDYISGGGVSRGLAVDLSIGNHQSSGNESFDGAIDEPRIYSRALSASEIWSLYQSGKPDEVNTGASQIDPLEKGMVGYWKLDDGSGTSATDSSGNANTGTLTNGPTWTTGQIGGAVNFDGTNDEITTTNSISASNFTLSTWFKTPSSSGKKIVGFEDQQTGTGSGIYVDTIFVGTDGKLKFAWFAGGVQIISSANSYADNAWHHAVATHIASGTVALYVDGVLQGTGTGGVTFNNGYWRIGGYACIGVTDCSNGYFPGSIDEVRVYNRALSADEVTKLYKTTAPDDPDTGLVGYWSFNGPDLSGTTAYDRSGKGNNGTLTNGPRVIPGKAGQGLVFDGSDDRISYGNISTLKPSFPFTIMAWVKGTGGAVFSNGKGEYFCSPATPYADNYSGIVFYMNGGVAGGNTAGQSSSNRFERAASVSAADGQWHHIAAVLQAGNNINLYKDGVLNNGSYDDGTATTIAYDTRPVLVGAAYGCGYMYHANGTIDEVRIYNRVLTAAEITAIYNAGR